MIPIFTSAGPYNALIEACNRLSDRYDFVGQIGKTVVEPKFPSFRLAAPEVFHDHIRRAELVISHGGTGLLSMIYKHRKRCVVVPRQVRYGAPTDEQVPLAKKWCELGIGILCMDVDRLEEAIEECRRVNPVFPDFPPLGQAVRQLLEKR